MQLPSQCLLLLIGSVLLGCWAAADDVIMPSTEAESYEEERPKRPFCNAFTGCGRKRSAIAVPFPLVRTLRSDDLLSTLVDLNAEPAVAELSRQILSEAKLWEAMQEAREELDRRQHKPEVAPRRVGALRSLRRRRSLLMRKDAVEHAEDAKEVDVQPVAAAAATAHRD